MKTNNTKLNNASIGLCILLMGLCTACMSQMSESETDKSAGFNGGFEKVKNKLPINWLVYTQKTCGEGNFEIAPDVKEFKEGKQSLKFDVTSCSNKGGRFSPGIAQEVEAETGSEYLLTFWVKNSGTTCKADLYAVSATEKVNGPNLLITESFNAWRKFEFRYKMPEKMKRLRIELNVLSAGKIWMDDIKLEKLN